MPLERMVREPRLRRRLEAKVRFTNAPASEHAAFVVNLSKGGLCLEAAFVPVRGTALLVDVVLPSGTRARASGVVQWSRVLGTLPRPRGLVGLRLRSADGVLTRFIDGCLMRAA